MVFSYYNVIYSYGLEKFAADAEAAGVDAVLSVDLPLEERDELLEVLRPHGLTFVPLIAPTTSIERTIEAAKGLEDSFLYVITVKGTTGARTELPPELKERLAAIRAAVNMPIAAGFGISTKEQVKVIGEVADGFMPDTAYAAGDIDAAVERIVRETGADRVDILGWSWGTMTAGKYAAGHPLHLGRLVLYGPVLVGLEGNVGDAPFSHNTWEGAAEDFQRRPDGRFDEAVTDPVVIDLFCSRCWRYDGDSSPNGWRRDAFAGPSERLIDLDSIAAPTLVICGSRDPYMNWDAVNHALEHLPEGSRLEIIAGGSHIMLYEKPYYREFQDRVVRFLNGT